MSLAEVGSLFLIGDTRSQLNEGTRLQITVQLWYCFN